MYWRRASMIQSRLVPESSRLGLLLLPLVAGALWASRPLHGQTGIAQEVPIVEPSLHRLYGSDDLDFHGLFMSGAISPDGRWLVFSRADVADPSSETAEATGGSTDRMNLWIVPLFEPGEATKLTTGAYMDAGPLWFPTGDRLLFRSTRSDPEGHFQFLMTLDIDPSNGRARGLPRQLTLEPVGFTLSYQISPDGHQVVYLPRPTEGDRETHILKVLPARGGQASTLWSQEEYILRPVWARDGFIYFNSSLWDGVNRGLAVRRIPAGGGEAETLSRWPGALSGAISSDGVGFLHRRPDQPGGPPFGVGSVRGDIWARFSLPFELDLGTCALGETNKCLAVTENSSAPLKVIPINGGPTRQITESGGQTHPLGWTADGKQLVFLLSRLDHTQVLMSTSIDGGVMEELFRHPGEDWAYGPSVLNGRFLFYGVDDSSQNTVVLSIRDLRTGSEREITRTAWIEFTRHLPSIADDRFVYAERDGRRFEYRAVDPEGEDVLLAVFSDMDSPPLLGLGHNRMAYWTHTGDRSTLHVADFGEVEADSVLTFPGLVGVRGSSGVPRWSPDGRYLATALARPETNTWDLLLVEFDGSGEVIGEPRVMDLPGIWYDLRWMPDSQSFLVLGGESGDQVWLVSLRPGQPPVNLTLEEPGSVWSYRVSPDGRYVAVSPEVGSGGSIWSVDLDEILKEYRR